MGDRFRCAGRMRIQVHFVAFVALVLLMRRWAVGRLEVNDRCLYTRIRVSSLLCS